MTEFEKREREERMKREQEQHERETLRRQEQHEQETLRRQELAKAEAARFVPQACDPRSTSVREPCPTPSPDRARRRNDRAASRK